MGLRFPADLEAWQGWQLGRQSVTRRLRGRWVAMRAPGASPTVWVTRSAMAEGGAARVVGVLDSRSPTARQSVLTPLLALDGQDVTLLSSSPITDLLPRGQWRQTQQPLAQAMSSLIHTETVVVAIGHFLPFGAAAFGAAQTVDATFVTVQHGLLTPFAPPLAPGTTLLAWSQEDADFWTTSRGDVTARVVGSSLQWEARGQEPAAAQPELVDPGRVPVYLGQLHAAELPRRALVGSAESFIKETGATYRPHPAETDRVSRAIHRRWERTGITLDRSGVALPDLARPVVSAFSTGVLEAAARGIPAWVHFDNPPKWLQDFWQRYGMRPWGGEPTPPPAVPDLNPALAIAQQVRAMMES